jgi:hypothetical protein
MPRFDQASRKDLGIYADPAARVGRVLLAHQDDVTSQTSPPHFHFPECPKGQRGRLSGREIAPGPGEKTFPVTLNHAHIPSNQRLEKRAETDLTPNEPTGDNPKMNQTRTQGL